jgi:uncharacterized membrane protein YhaH (DUF805 family)
MAIDLFSRLKIFFIICGRRLGRLNYFFMMLFNLGLAYVAGCIFVYWMLVSSWAFIFGNQEGPNEMMLLFSALLMIIVILIMVILTVRRLHDLNLSGWFCCFLLIPYINIFCICLLFVIEGTPGDNSYGPSPKALST